MTTVPMQVLVVELEDGRRGVFFGRPLLNSSDEAEHEVENVWFSDVNQVSDSANFGEISKMAISFFMDASSSVH